MPTKILAIDDSKTMRLAIKITFAAEDAEVTSVSKGSEAVARAKQMGADVILLDANLGDGDASGLDLCRQLKSDGETSKIPIIMLVSNQSATAQSDLDSAGADDSLAKPFDTQELIDKVAAVQGQPVKAAAAAAAPKPAATPVPKPKPAPPPAAPPVAAKPVPKPPLSPPPAAKPAATPSPVAASRAAASRAARPAAPPRTPAPAAAAPKGRVQAVTEVGMPTPTPIKAPVRAPVSSPAAGGDIPIAVPIPFTAAASPTAGMLERLQKAAGDSGIDPQVAEALVKLSREVIEAVVWEVVPELAESIIKKAADDSAA